LTDFSNVPTYYATQKNATLRTWGVPPPPRHPRFVGAVATKIKQRNRTDDADTDGCQAVFNSSVSTNAINTHHFEMFSDKICSEKSNYVAQVSGADVATERKVRGTVRRTVGLRYTALTPPPQNTIGRHDTLHRATDHGNNGYDTPPTVLRSLPAASELVVYVCVRMTHIVANLVSQKIKQKTYYFYYSRDYSHQIYGRLCLRYYLKSWPVNRDKIVNANKYKHKRHGVFDVCSQCSHFVFSIKT